MLTNPADSDSNVEETIKADRLVRQVLAVRSLKEFKAKAKLGLNLLF